MPDEPLYQPIESEEFRNHAVVQPCQERLELMRPFLAETGRMLDLGCHTGWFCRAFARIGWTTVGIDRSPDWLETAKALNWLVPDDRPKPEYRRVNLFQIPELPDADVVLCLSLAMYLFEDIRAGWDLMRRISQAAPQMFLDFGGMYRNRLPFDESNVIDQIRCYTAYTEAQFLGRTQCENRPFYRFAR